MVVHGLCEHGEAFDYPYLQVTFDNCGKPAAIGQIQGNVKYISYDTDSSSPDNKNILSLAELYTEKVIINPEENVTNFTITLPQTEVNNAVYRNDDYAFCTITNSNQESATINFTSND